jgi:hypothetical protein
LGKTVNCHDANVCSYVAEVWDKVFAHFHAVTVKFTVECGTDCSAHQDKFFVKNPLDVKDDDESMLLTSLFTCLAFFGLRKYGLFHSNTRVWLILYSLHACLIIARVSAAHFSRSA